MSVQDLLGKMVAAGASDIVFSAGSPPCMRVQGAFQAYGQQALNAESMSRMVGYLLDEAQKVEFQETGALNTARTIPGAGRFRVAAYRQRGAVSVALRPIQAQVPALEELYLPSELGELADLESGLVVVTGLTGSGRTTTLASLVDRINATRSLHVVTIEDPVEYLHARKSSLVEQRELGRDTPSYLEALRDVRRQAPDVVVVSELPDLETIAAALKIAEAGQLVLVAMTTPRTAMAVDRLIEVFPEYQQQQVRVQLSWALRAVVAQQLLPAASGTGVRPACEILKVTDVVAKHIRDGKTHLLDGLIAENMRRGMIRMEDAIAGLVQRGEVAPTALGRVGKVGAGPVSAPGAEAAASPSRALEKELYSSDQRARQKAEAALKELEASGDPEAAEILRQFTQFYVTNFEDKKIGLKR